jgi:uncharacterized phage protein (TIGR02220 family)
MRIRRVKPEFWTHPVMSTQRDDTQLIAIGLLNYADDEGYFYADPRLVRAAIRPFDDDSKKIRRALSELSQIGYLEVSKHESHGLIGRVVSFLSHQRIDKPRKSAIRPFFNGKAVVNPFLDDSTNLPRIVQEPSKGEWNGKEQGEEHGMESVLSSCDGSDVLKLDMPEPDGTKHYHRDCRTVLHFLNEQSGSHFREVDAHLDLITARLREDGVTLDGVRKMISRQCAKWKSEEGMSEYLRPQTLFAKKNFAAYYDSRDLPLQSNVRPAESRQLQEAIEVRSIE